MAIALLLVALWMFLLWLGRRYPQPVPPRVFIDDVGARRELGDGGIEYVAWRDLIGIDIVTTSCGPFADDFFFVLHGRDGRGCLVPLAFAEPLLARFRALDGFDRMAVIQACGSTCDARFVCWRAPDARCD
jgi:hypothetical protein